MHPYLPHLLDDIKLGHRPNTPQGKSEKQSIEEKLKEVDDYVHGSPAEHKLGYYCGLNQDDFPPAEQLSTEDIKRVAEAFSEMIFTWNIHLSLPDELPLPIHYKFILKSLEIAITPMNFGRHFLDFCTGYAPDCDFGKYCPCMEFWKEDQ